MFWKRFKTKAEADRAGGEAAFSGGPLDPAEQFYLIQSTLGQHSESLGRTESALQQILSLLKELAKMSASISVNLQALMTQVAQTTSVEASAVTLIQGIATQLSAAIANSDDSALPALVTDLNTSATALAAAVAANTPAAPPTPAPTPTPVPSSFRGKP
jgi:hypothetical protein